LTLVDEVLGVLEDAGGFGITARAISKKIDSDASVQEIARCCKYSPKVDVDDDVKPHKYGLRLSRSKPKRDSRILGRVMP